MWLKNKHYAYDWPFCFFLAWLIPHPGYLWSFLRLSALKRPTMSPLWSAVQAQTRLGVFLTPWPIGEVKIQQQSEHQYPLLTVRLSYFIIFFPRGNQRLQHSRGDFCCQGLWMVHREGGHIPEVLLWRQDASGARQASHLWWLHVLLSVSRGHDVSVDSYGNYFLTKKNKRWSIFFLKDTNYKRGIKNFYIDPSRNTILTITYLLLPRW